MPEVTYRIEHADGSTESLDGTRSVEEYELDKMDTASAYALRPDVNNVSLVEDEDEVYIQENGSDVFGGILRDLKRGGAEVELMLESFERLALDSEPTSGDDNYEGVDDSTVVSDAVSDMAEISAGTIQTVVGDISPLFSHVSQAKKVRTVRDITGAEISYNTDKTLDYKPELGSGRTSIVLSPGNQYVVDSFRPKKVGGDKRVTHLRMLGEGEGEAQVSVEVVADNYSAGDRQRWETYINKEISDEDTLEEEANTKLAELQEEFVEIETTLKGISVSLGDEFHVQYPEENIDRDLRVVQQQRTMNKDGVKHQVVLSNRANAREEDADKETRDVDRYNTSFEGSPVTYSTNGGRQPVTPDFNYEFSVYYPDEVTHEHRMELQVKGLPYRGFTAGAAAAGGAHSHEVDFDLPDHDHDLDVTDHTHTVPVQVTTPNDSPDSNNVTPLDIATSRGTETTITRDFTLPNVTGKGKNALIYLHISYSDSHKDSGALQATIEDTDTGNVLYDDSDVTQSFDGGDSNHLFVSETGDNLNGNTIQITVDVTGATDDGSFRFSYGAVLIGDHQHTIDETTTSEADGGFLETTANGGGLFETRTTTEVTGEHSHDPEPGIIEEFVTGQDQNGNDIVEKLYPENVDVLVNGTQLGLSYGDGSDTFEETADLTGQLNQGQWNTIEITSEAKGHIQAHLDLDVYRQVRGGG